MKETIFLVLIFIIALLIRFTFFPQNVYFGYDQARDSYTSLEILKGHPKDAKMRLAREVVTMYHSADAAQKVGDDWTNTFSKGEVPTDAPTVAAGKLRDIVKDISTSELRRLVEQGAVSSMTTNKKIDSIETEISNDTIRIGKHRFFKVK